MAGPFPCTPHDGSAEPRLGEGLLEWLCIPTPDRLFNLLALFLASENSKSPCREVREATVQVDPAIVARAIEPDRGADPSNLDARSLQEGKAQKRRQRPPNAWRKARCRRSRRRRRSVPLGAFALRADRGQQALRLPPRIPPTPRGRARVQEDRAGRRRQRGPPRLRPASQGWQAKPYGEHPCPLELHETSSPDLSLQRCSFQSSLGSE